MRNARSAPAAAPIVVGREPELSRIDAFVAAVATGPRALLITGEPGIGKTTLWRYAVHRCHVADHRILTTRPAEEEMPIPLVGLRDILEETEAAGMPLHAGSDPFAAGRAALEALSRLADAGDVVVVIDDLQWLDPASARALRFAFRRLDRRPIGLIAALRSGADRPDPLDIEGTLFRGRCQTLHLRPLSLEEVRRVLGQVISAISRPILRRIHEISGGNPLYAIELARGLTAQELSRGSPANVRLPDSLRSAIAERLGAVPAGIIPLLELVSGLGPTTVAGVRDAMPESDVDALLLVAQEQGLLAVEDDLTVRFSHPLLASAVYARMGPLARHALHARLAERSEAPDMRARHLALSVDSPDEVVAALLEEAAARAGRRGAADLAAAFAGHSVRLTPAANDEAARRRALAEVVHLAAGGEVSRALELADGLIARLPAGTGRAEVSIQRAFLEDDDPALTEADLVRALDDAGDDRAVRGRVLDVLGWHRGTQLGDVRGGAESAREAVAIAVEIGDAELEMFAQSSLAHLEALAGAGPSDRMAGAVALEERVGNASLWAGPRGLLARQLLWAGDLPAARSLCEALVAGSAGSAKELLRPTRLRDLALVECAAGNLARADQLIERAVQGARDAGYTWSEAQLRHARGLVDTWLGRLPEARAVAELLLERGLRRGERPAVVRARGVLGLIALSENDVATAAAELTAAVDMLEEMGVEHPGAFPALPDAIEATARSGDPDRAEALLERLEGQAAAVRSPWAHASAQRGRGVVLLARGETHAAVEALQRAGAGFDVLGFQPDAARAVLLRGLALHRAGIRARAADALADARRRFAGIGAPVWESRAAWELERVAPGRAGGELTRAEARVAALVAEGNKNREIAQALFMSIATVEAHLTRIYRKLRIRSRSELTRMVADGRVSGPGLGDDGARADAQSDV